MSDKRMDWLDGLRGLSALGVVAYHSAVFFSAFSWTPAWGNMPSEILSRFTNGNFFVCIFFLLSGYVLVIPRVKKPAIEPGYWGELLFRRYFRLTPVVLASVMLAYLLWITIGIPNQLITSYGPGFAYFASEYNFEPSFFHALYYGTVGLYTFPVHQYNAVLWTVAFELFGSALLFACMALFPRMKGFVTASAIGSIVILFYEHSKGSLDKGIYFVLFFVGALMHLLSVKLPSSRVVKWVLLVFAIYLGGINMHAAELSGWIAETLSLTSYDMDAIVHSVAAIVLVLVVLSSAKLQKTLSAPLVVWIGNISFSVYAVHSVVIFTIGLNLYIALETLFGTRVAGCLVYILIFAVSMAIAWILTKYVDVPSQKFAKKIASFLVGNKAKIEG